jgi:hypothetical protein
MRHVRMMRRIHMDTKTTDRPSWLELESVLAPSKIEQITTLSWETVQRRHPDKVIELSPRRRGDETAPCARDHQRTVENRSGLMNRNAARRGRRF